MAPDEFERLLIGIVAVGAVICLAPVLFGLAVARWDKRWSRADRKGPLR